MSNVIDCLTSRGLTITLTNNNEVNVKPSRLVTKEISTYIKSHIEIIKSELLADMTTPAIKGQLTTQQLNWLNEIAYYLQVKPEYLLQHQFIDKYDLVELLGKEPVLLASSIKTNPRWQY